MTKTEKIKDLKRQIQSKKDDILEAKKMADRYNSLQLALKLVMNGSYGALANKHFVLFCNGVASTITAHGRDLVQHMDIANEDYWYNQWHLDTELHLELEKYRRILEYINFNDLSIDFIFGDDEEGKGRLMLEKIKTELDIENTQCPKVKPIDPSWVDAITRIKVEKPIKGDTRTGAVVRNVPVSVYIDTDSLFVGYKPGIDSMGWDQDNLQFILKVSELRIQPHFKIKLDEYAAKYGVENKQDFELEQISKSIIFLAKKMYVKNVVWDEGVFSEPETSLQAKGVDLVRSSSPKFTRDKVYDILKYFFQNPNNMNDRELVKMVRNLKELFKLEPIENISMSSSCNNYAAKVIDDQDSLQIVKGAHHAVKAAALHNYLLNNNSDYKTKYSLLKSGNKIKYYYTTSKLNNEFAYSVYPKEIADKYAPIDIDKQFEKTILNIVNRFGSVLGLSPLNPQLTFTLSLF